jgi:hypothetical protein
MLSFVGENDPKRALRATDMHVITGAGTPSAGRRYRRLAIRQPAD